MRTIITLILAAGLASGQLPIELMKRKPFDYYVDSVNGSDASAGRSRGSAWKTIAKWQEHTQRTGERTGLAANSHWREQATATATLVTIAAYGSGAKPLLDASDVIAAGAWSKTGGLTNVYQATVAIAGGNSWVNVWQDSAYMVRATSTANCDATANSYYPSSDTAVGNITLYVHASDHSDPASSGKVYEFTARPHGLTTWDATAPTIRNIATRRNLHNDGSLVLGRGSRAYGVDAADGGKHNILVRANSYMEDSTASGRYYTPLADALIVSYEPTLDGSEVNEFVRVAVSNSVYNADSDGFYAHGGGVGHFAQVKYTDCSATKCRRGWNIDDNTATEHRLVDSVAIANHSGIRAGIANVVADGLSMSGNTNYNIWSAGAGSIFSLNRFVTVDKDPFFSSANNVTVSLTNSTLAAANYMVYIVGTNPTVTASGNAYGAAGQQWYYLDATTTLTSDNNAFTNPTSRGNYAFFHNGTYYSWAAYRAATGQDAHSTPAP